MRRMLFAVAPHLLAGRSAAEWAPRNGSSLRGTLLAPDRTMSNMCSRIATWTILACLSAGLSSPARAQDSPETLRRASAEPATHRAQPPPKSWSESIADSLPGSWSREFGTPGLDGTPLCATLYRGDLVVGGAFTSADGAPASHIARWDGTRWQPLGAGCDGNVWALTVWQGRLIAGGAFSGSGSRYTGPLAEWDGLAWSTLGGAELDGAVFSLSATDSDLVIGGSFQGYGPDSVHNVVRWDGRNWDAMGGGTDGSVLAVARHRGEVAIAGVFTQLGAVRAGSVATWDGSSWHALGSGLATWQNSPIPLALASDGSSLFVGGQFDSAGGLPTGGFARWDGSSWSAIRGTSPSITITTFTTAAPGLLVGGWWRDDAGLMRFSGTWDGVTFTSDPKGPDDMVNAIVVAADRTYYVGPFRTVRGRPALRVVSRTGEAWSPLVRWHAPMHGLDGYVTGFARLGSWIVAAGEFQTAADDTGWIETPGVAAYHDGLWHPMGSLANSNHTQFVWLDSRLYATDGDHGAAWWSGTDWVPTGHIIGAATSLTAYRNALWCGGACTGACGQYTGLWRLADTNWVAVPRPVGITPDVATVSAMSTVDEHLLVAWAEGSDYWQPSTRIASWEGTTWTLLPGVFAGGRILTMCSFQGRLCVGGDFTSVDGAQAAGFAEFADGGWRARTGYGAVQTITPIGSRLMVAGGYGIELYDGADWTPFDRTAPSGVTALFIDGETLWCGGWFTQVDGSASMYVARWDPASPEVAAESATKLRISPNPIVLAARLKWTLARSGQCRVRVFDVAGHLVTTLLDARLSAGPATTAWSGARAVRAGVYWVSIELDGRPLTRGRVVYLR